MNKSWQNSPRKLSFEVLLTSEARKMQWNPDVIAIHCETKTYLKFFPQQNVNIFQKSGVSSGIAVTKSVKADETIDFTTIK